MGQQSGNVWGYMLFSLVGIVSFVLGITAFSIWLFSMVPAGSGGRVKIIEIHPGMSGIGIAELLQKEGIVRDREKFYLLCRIRQASPHLQAGEYEFLSLSTPNQIIDQLVSGRVYIRRVTFPEGLTLREVAVIFEDTGFMPQEEFLALVNDETVVQSLGIDAPSLEGYLFPDTYHFNKSTTAMSLLKTMVRQFRENLPARWEERAGELGLTFHELVILASVVEKEAAVDTERPLVSAVFHNRLRMGMPLQSDPTAVYDLEDFSGPVRPEHLRRPSPYNTYLNRGLPAGPICNPGKRSIQATLYPADVDYLYFVSNNDGTHHFSRTFQEHSRAVARYRLLRAREREKAAAQAQQAQ